MLCPFKDQNLKKEFIIKGFSNSDFLLKAFKEMLLNQGSIQKTKKVRVFKNKGVRDDLSLKYQSLKMTKEDDIKDYFKSELLLENYCIALSQIEKYSNEISDYFTEHIIDEWNKEYGNQTMGFELYSFFGEYDTTPFGVHKDQEHTILIHIGPNPAKVFCWNEDLDLNEVDIHNLNNISSPPRIYNINPGDLLVIPKKIPHTVKRQEFSITLGAIPYTIEGLWIIERFIKNNLENKLAKVNISDTDSEEKNSPLLSKTLTEFFNQMDFEKSILNESKRLKSNGGLINNNILDKTNDYLELKKTKEIVINYDKDKICIFISGRHIEIINAPSISLLLSQLSKLRVISKENAINILSEDFDYEASVQIYNALL